MKRNSLLSCGAILCFSVLPICADEASKTAKVEEFFRLAKMDEMLRQTLALSASQVKSGMLQEMIGVKLPPEIEKSQEEFQDKITRIISDALAWEKIEPAYVKLFAEAYSEQELDDIVAFYRSPTGQAMVSKGPSLMTKASEIVQQRMAIAMPELQKLMRDFMAQAAQAATQQPQEKKK